MSGAVPRRTLLAGSVASALLASGCSDAGGNAPPSSTSPPARAPERPLLRPGSGSVWRLTGDAGELSVAASRAAYVSSPVAVVVAGDTDLSDGPRDVADLLGIPLLQVGDADVAGELDRLGAARVVAYGLDHEQDRVLGRRVTVPGATGAGAAEHARSWLRATGALDDLGLPTNTSDTVVITGRTGAREAAALATLRAAGCSIVYVRDGDVRTSSAAVRALRAPTGADGGGARAAAQRHGDVVGIGGGLGTASLFRERVHTAAAASELPGGGLVLFPYRRMVALYGHPGTPALGVLGEQGVKASVRRVRALARRLAAVSDTPVVPAWEIIATVASSSAGPDGNYSTESRVADLEPWVDAAAREGIYVVLDLQPGRTSFLHQARRYEHLLRQPHVGLALDPEWRLAAHERPLTRIGSVDIDEVNAVVTWLADLVRRHTLPQKLLTLHEFQTSMLPDRARLDTSRDELAVLIHADGQGSQGQKHNTWRSIRDDLPDNVWMGWKNFYDEDSPVLTPRETMSRVRPRPWFISYQ